MKSVMLYPKAAPADRVRVWLGILNIVKAPDLTWRINGTISIPTVVRRLQSVRPTDPSVLGSTSAKTPRAFSGVYEFSHLSPNTSYTVDVQVNQAWTTLHTRTLPLTLPSGPDGWFNLLLVSCFHAAEDQKGLAGQVVNRLPAPLKPHLTVFMGDQVYLDLPTLKDFKNDASWLAEKFEWDYIMNWAGDYGFSQVLEAAPSVSISDDHEFWNNYPHWSPIIQNSLSPLGRKNWEAGAQLTYNGFQADHVRQPDMSQSSAAIPGEYCTLDIPPLSFFIADSRWYRKANHQACMAETARTALKKWVEKVENQRGYGVFVTGQSLYDKAASTWEGAVGDYTLPNYRDFPDIVRNLVSLVDGGRPLLFLTGDVHWGRVMETRESSTGRLAMYEIIVSPASLVSTAGLDQVKRFGAWVTNWFGNPDPWPRHNEPVTPPPVFFAKESPGEGCPQPLLGHRFLCRQVHGQKGNHIAVLSFRQEADRLALRLTYFPIHADPQVAHPVQVSLPALGSLLS